jgi:membrane protease YdiL (CAAX protease family)
MLKNSPIRNLILTIFLILAYQSAGIYFSIFFQPRSNFYILPFIQIVFLLIPLWYLSGTTWEERTDFLRLSKIEFNINLVINLVILALAFQLFYAAFSYFQEKLLEGTYLTNFINIKKLRNNSIRFFFMDDSALNYIYGAIAIGIVPAICEEVLFRGFLQNSYKNQGKIKAAIFIPAVVFSVSHLNPVDMIPLFIMSVILAQISIKSGTTYYSILLHLIINLIVVLTLSFYPASREQEIVVIKDNFYGIIMLAISIGLMYYSLKGFFKNIEPKESEAGI